MGRGFGKRFGETSVWNNVEVLLLVIIVWKRYLALYNDEKGKFFPEILFRLINITSFETQGLCNNYKEGVVGKWASCRKILGNTPLLKE